MNFEKLNKKSINEGVEMIRVNIMIKDQKIMICKRWLEGYSWGLDYSMCVVYVNKKKWKSYKNIPFKPI